MKLIKTLNLDYLACSYNFKTHQFSVAHTQKQIDTITWIGKLALVQVNEDWFYQAQSCTYILTT